MAGGKLDTLTCRSGDLPQAGDDRSLENQTIVMKPQNILYLSVTATLTPTSLILVRLFTDVYKEDVLPNKILKVLRDSIK
jgi:hypothetical protein